MSPTLQPSQTTDRDFLYQVYASSRADELAPLEWSPDQQRAFLEMQFEAQDRDYRKRYPQARFDVVVRGQDRIGRLYVDRGENEIRILDVCLLPEHRNRGLGTQLIRKLLEEGRKSGRTVGICVENYNPAHRLFQRFGFMVAEEDGPLLFMKWSPRSEIKTQLERAGIGSAPVTS